MGMQARKLKTYELEAFRDTILQGGSKAPKLGAFVLSRRKCKGFSKLCFLRSMQPCSCCGRSHNFLMSQINKTTTSLVHRPPGPAQFPFESFRYLRLFLQVVSGTDRFNILGSLKLWNVMKASRRRSRISLPSKAMEGMKISCFALYPDQYQTSVDGPTTYLHISTLCRSPLQHVASIVFCSLVLKVYCNFLYFCQPTKWLRILATNLKHPLPSTPCPFTARPRRLP